MVCVLFPSPAGVFFISSVFEYFSSKTLLYVSVPCRGLFYFISTRTKYTSRTQPFPSPAGGFFISSKFMIFLIILKYLFLSPAGGFFISSTVQYFIHWNDKEFPSPAGGFFISSKQK